MGRGATPTLLWPLLRGLFFPCTSVSSQSFSTTFAFSLVKVNNKLGFIYSRLLYEHTGFKDSEEFEGCLGLQLHGIDLETLLQALGDSWHTVPPLSNNKVESQPCVVLQGEGGQGSFILYVQFHSCSGQVSVALHVSVSHSWCSRVRKGGKGSLQNQKLTTLLSMMPSVSLSCQQSRHTKHRISCFGLGGARDKSAVTCSLQRPRASNAATLCKCLREGFMPYTGGCC